MRIIGIDPGTTSIGYGIIEGDRHTPLLLHAGLLPVTSKEQIERLCEISRRLKELITQWKPTHASVEKLYFAKNIKTAMAVSEARGVILLTAKLAGITVYEYTPLTIKKMVTGDGSADKKQVQKMVHLILKETQTLKSQDDMFDAIASALACLYQEGGNYR